MNPRPYTKYLFLVFLFIYFIIVIRPWDLYFLNDDFLHIPFSPQAVWVHLFFFRPVANLLTAAELKLYGNNPAGFHFTSILLHLVTSYLVTVLTNTLLKKYGQKVKYKQAGFITGCLFFIYPFHAEPLMWVIGRGGIIATFFYILSLLFYLKSTNRYHQILSILFFIPALFTYEVSWTLPLVITVLAITDHYTTNKNLPSTIRALLPHWIVFGFFLSIRFASLHTVLTKYDFESRQLNALTLSANFFRLFARTLVPPTQNSALFIMGFLLVITLLAGLVIYMKKKKQLSSIHLVIACSLCLSYLPVISLGMDTHGTEGERYLYLPSVFWLMLLVLLLYALSPAIKKTAIVTLFILYGYWLANAAHAYLHASHIAKKIIATINPPTPVKKIIALNIPANYKGALIYRMSFDDALRWMRPSLKFDSLIAIPAARTYEEIPDSLQIINNKDLPATGLSFQITGTNSLVISYNDTKIPYAPKTDMLLFFPPHKPGIIIYPQP